MPTSLSLATSPIDKGKNSKKKGEKETYLQVHGLFMFCKLRLFPRFKLSPFKL